MRRYVFVYRLQTITLLLGWAVVTALLTLSVVYSQWAFFIVLLIIWTYGLYSIYRFYRRNIKKVTFMFDAIDNADYAFKYATDNVSPDDKLVNESLNRITGILRQARDEAIQQEKYYELIINSVDSGILVVDERGNVYQRNQKVLQLLGISVLTHILQLERISEELQTVVQQIMPGEKRQVSVANEKGITHLSVRASSTTIKEKKVRIIAINDINSEMDENEVDSWIKLSRVLTHEIMNAITPVTSLSETLLSKTDENSEEIKNGLEIIHDTSKGLLHFVDNYRKFTHIPTPLPALFYAVRFAERMKQLAMAQADDTDITITTEVTPEDLIVFADEKLISHVVLNLLKNAIQAIHSDKQKGHIWIKAYCDSKEAVYIDIVNDGPLIPAEEMAHIFVPFFTTKPDGNGIGLSISRQIMRLSGGTLSLKSDTKQHLTTFSLMFP